MAQTGNSDSASTDQMGLGDLPDLALDFDFENYDWNFNFDGIAGQDPAGSCEDSALNQLRVTQQRLEEQSVHWERRLDNLESATRRLEHNVDRCVRYYGMVRDWLVALTDALKDHLGLASTVPKDIEEASE